MVGHFVWRFKKDTKKPSTEAIKTRPKSHSSASISTATSGVEDVGTKVGRDQLDVSGATSIVDIAYD